MTGESGQDKTPPGDTGSIRRQDRRNMKRRDFTRLAAGAAGAMVFAAPGWANDVPTSRGPVTGLPLPRYVSLKGHKGNVRRGPGFSNRIDWVFTRVGMPLRVTAEYGHWRRVEDQDGLGGWIFYTLISGVRTVVFTQPMTNWRDAPESDARLDAKSQEGVIARLYEARLHWVRVGAEGSEGWVRKSAVWGVDPDEVFS